MFPFRSFSEEVLCLVSLFATIPSREDAPSMQSGGACVCAPLFCHQELFVPPPHRAERAHAGPAKREPSAHALGKPQSLATVVDQGGEPRAATADGFAC